MKIKDWQDNIKEEHFGMILEGDLVGRPSYEAMPTIKQVWVGEGWKDNPGYNLTKAKQKIIKDLKDNANFKTDLLIYGVIDSLISSETNAKVKALYQALQSAAISNLQDYKQKILDNS